MYTFKTVWVQIIDTLILTAIPYKMFTTWFHARAADLFAVENGFDCNKGPRFYGETEFETELSYKRLTVLG